MSKSYIGFKAMDMGFDAHVTMLYLGKLTPQEEAHCDSILSLLTLKLMNNWANNWAMRDELKMFGPNNDIPVVTLEKSDYLSSIRSTLELTFNSPSEYGFNPHITLDLNGMHTIRIPTAIRLVQFGLY